MASGDKTGAPSAPEPPKRFITTHNAEGRAVFSQMFDDTVSTNSIPGMAYYEAYKTFKTPIQLSEEADLKEMKAHAHEDSTITFPKPGEVILRYCDWGPGEGAPLHRHESIDFGIVVHGEIEAFLDSGETRRLRVGDVLVQRNTLHGWRNPSETDYARVLYVIQGTEPVVVAGKEMKIDLGKFA
jgi:quercetin dioxygenase-like cupin family protein